MSLVSESRPEPKGTPRVPEPLRRKRVQLIPASTSPRRRRMLNIVLGFAAAVLLIDSFVGEKGLIEGLRAKRTYDQAEAQLNSLRAQNASMRNEVRRLREDPAAIEALARQEFGFIRPGELLFIVRDVTPAPR